jgi:Xaa-Pro dipeptidase
MTTQIDAIQQALREEGLNGWLFFDHHGRDPLAYRALGLRAASPTRRWYYYIPAQGEPQRLVHRIESKQLDELPGQLFLYSSWSEQKDQLASILQGMPRVAMQYSPLCAIPYISNVDAGTIELVRSCGAAPVSSASLVQYFEARWTEQQLSSHLRAGKLVDSIRAAAFEQAHAGIASGNPRNEWQLACWIREQFDRNNLFSDHGPIVGVNANSSDPHFSPSQEAALPIRDGDFLLIDMWAKLREPQAVYYDITWTAFFGVSPSTEMMTVFDHVIAARDAAAALVQKRKREAVPLAGYEVDDACRSVIIAAGFGDKFVHRTGHSIGEDVHGNGANMDNLESHDTRPVIARTCFSIEPGIYIGHFGVRSEVNVYVSEDDAFVTGEIQRQLLRFPVA